MQMMWGMLPPILYFKQTKNFSYNFNFQITMKTIYTFITANNT